MASVQPSRLPPLHWVAEVPLVYDERANELHRPSCSKVTAIDQELDVGGALELIWAPRLCGRCSPDVTLALRSTGAAAQAG